MATRRSEFASYVFIRNDLEQIGWNARNPSRGDGGQLYTQQECLDHPEIGAQLGRQRPEYVVKVQEDAFWVIEAKGSLAQINDAFSEALDYARQINRSHLITAPLVTGVAGNDSDGYLVQTAFLYADGRTEPVTYNGRQITGFLSPEQARGLVRDRTGQLNDLITTEAVLLNIAEQVNEELHRASINKDARATVMASVLLSLVSDTLPNFNASPDVFIRDINNRAEDVLIQHSKREFADYIELRLPQQDAAKEKYKAAVVKVFFLLRKINIRAAMDGSHDLLGKFYEVFLKYGNGAKDIGIVLTPRHVTEFAAEALNVSADDLVFDPACGTGGFLVAAYDRVRRLEPAGVEMFKKHRVFGVEQQGNVAALAVVNMIFRGDGKNNIINGDCFAFYLNRRERNGQLSAEYVTDRAPRRSVTKVLMNPPFALKRDDEQEYRFVSHALDQMIEDGLLFAVLPVSVMYASGAERAWRQTLAQSNSLLAVISMPVDLFYPQASVEPLLVVIRRGVPHRADTNTLFARIVDDGFVKLKKRRLPHGGPNELDELLPELRSFLAGGPVQEKVGRLQLKRINLADANDEWIPQAYLDNAPLSQETLRTAIATLYRETLFEEIRRGAADAN